MTDDEFQDLYASCLPRLIRGVYAMTGDWHEAQEIANVVLCAALRELPHAQRVAVVLHYFFDLSLEQVAAETESSVSAMKSRLFRARTALAAVLTEPHLEEQRHA